MSTLARKHFNKFQSDNTVLDTNCLEQAATQKDQNYEKEETAYIFKDGSAIVIGNHPRDTRVIANYGLSNDHQQL